MSLSSSSRLRGPSWGLNPPSSGDLDVYLGTDAPTLTIRSYPLICEEPVYPVQQMRRKSAQIGPNGNRK